jgi:DtxR family Mn-dependent transcriptional regulator
MADHAEATHSRAVEDYVKVRMIRRHRLIELFLVEVVGCEWDEVDEDAERLEHAVSDRLIERIDAKLGHPHVDPHGAPIPDPAGHIETPGGDLRLCDLKPGQVGRVQRVSDSSPGFLQHLSALGIRLGTEIAVVSVGPFQQMQVRMDDETTHLPREATEQIAIELIE